MDIIIGLVAFICLGLFLNLVPEIWNYHREDDVKLFFITIIVSIITYLLYRKKKELLGPQEIIKIRESYNLSQTMFAKILGISEKAIERYEKNGFRINFYKTWENLKYNYWKWSYETSIYLNKDLKSITFQKNYYDTMFEEFMSKN